ncbi:MAG: hypothetical protein WCL07_01215 [bacterium]
MTTNDNKSTADEPGGTLAPIHIPTVDELPLPKKIAILHSDVRREYFATESLYATEVGAEIYAGDVATYVNKLGIETLLLPADENLAAKLQSWKPDIAINLVDSIRGDETLSASVPGLLEMLHISYTGSGILGQSLNTNKFVVYELLQNNGIPVPSHALITDPGDMIDPELRYPLFPKLNNIHGSVDIAEDSICNNEKELRAKIKDLFSKYKQPILIDEFIAGKEVTIPILDGLNTKAYPALRNFGQEHEKEGYGLLTFEKKWTDYLDLGLTKYEDATLREYAKKAFEILKMSDYGRLDVRIDAANRYYFIDANTNPFFGPPKETHSTFSMILDMYGVSFTDVLRRLILNTQRDKELSNGK